MRKSAVAVSCLLLLLLLAAPASGQQNRERFQPLSFGVVPQQSATALVRSWGPFLAWLSRESGVPLTFATAPDIPEFENRLRAGAYDLAYMNPWHYVRFHEVAGYRALARQMDHSIQGLVVVAADSPITDIDMLRGQSLAFPAPRAFAASLLPRASLRARDIKITPRYVSSHDSVYLSVAKGLYPAGGGIVRTLNNMPDEVRARLRILWLTDRHTPHAIAAHPSVDAQALARVEAAMYRMHLDPLGRDLLPPGFAGLEPARDRDWDDIRALNLDDIIDQ
jgi:phosphonate transport system substrate-binding protein